MTKKEKEMVITSLLFTGCTDTSYSGDQDFVGLAIKLGKKYGIKNLKKTGLEFCENGEDPDKTDKVLKNFKVKLWEI